MNITKLTLIRDEQSIEIYRGWKYHLSSVEGLEDVDVENQATESQNIDGAIFQRTKYKPREVIINMSINANNYNNILPLKDALFDFIDTKKGVMQLKVERSGYTRMLNVYKDATSGFKTLNHRRFSDGQLVLMAYDPLYYSENETLVNLNGYTGGWSFPFKFPVVFETKTGNEKNVINSGQTDTSCIIQIYGPCTNPIITNISTGQYIQINKEILSGELLTIDTDIKSTSKVVLTKTDGTEESAFDYIDISSIPFFQLQKGDNILSYSNDEVAYNDVFVRYYNKYFGI